MDKIKNSKSKIEELSLQKKLSMFYVEELEDRLEMSAVAFDESLVDDSCWGGGDGDDVNNAC